MLRIFLIYMFTIDKKWKKPIENTYKNHIIYRILLIILLIPMLYAIFHNDLTLLGVIRIILSILVIRFIGKDFTDAIISTFFNKNSYGLTLVEKRKIKLRKIK